MEPAFTLTGVNLSLSTACSAKCIFCPIQRGGGSPRHMSVDIVRNIVEQVQREPALRAVKHFECGENGDAFLNPQALDCLRAIRQHVPDAGISIFTNFQGLDPEIAEILIKEKLVDRLWCNIDGHDETHYRAVKNAGLERARKNIVAFLKHRETAGARVPLNIACVNYHDYYTAIKKNFGFVPTNVKSPSEPLLRKNFGLIRAQWLPQLNQQLDSIQPVKFFFSWAEREKAALQPLNYKRYTCPALHRIRTEAFISPGGLWYACCMDAACELIIGDTTRTPLAELAKSPRRAGLINMLAARKFQEIGGPCKTVNCCEFISLHPIETRVRRVWRRVKPHVHGFMKRFQVRAGSRRLPTDQNAALGG